MNSDDVKQILIKSLVLQQLYVNQNDSNHFQIIAVDDQFVGMSIVQRQKIIYAPLMEYILEAHIHSLSIEVFTIVEWKQKCMSAVK